MNQLKMKLRVSKLISQSISWLHVPNANQLSSSKLVKSNQVQHYHHYESIITSTQRTFAEMLVFLILFSSRQLIRI